MKWIRTILLHSYKLYNLEEVFKIEFEEGNSELKPQIILYNKDNKEIATLTVDDDISSNDEEVQRMIDKLLLEEKERLHEQLRRR